MADYKTIHGTKVRSYTTDPDNPITGQVWYDKTNKVLQFQASGTASWSTGGNLNTARAALMGGAGTQIAALKFGGRSPNVANCEKYDGTSWTEVADMNSARSQGGGSGVQTSALAYAGETDANTRDLTESWNNTAWTEVADLNTGRHAAPGSAGVSNTSAFAFGGASSPQALCEKWDGTCWTEVADLNTARVNNVGSGTATACLTYGGAAPAKANTESWNNTCWSEVADLNTARSILGGAGTTNTNALAFGGEGPPARMAFTELYNGTCWSEVADLSTARDGVSGAGTQTAGLAFGGDTGSVSAATEEWDDPKLTIKTVDTD